MTRVNITMFTRRAGKTVKSSSFTHEQIDDQVAAFLKEGGTIEQIPIGISGESYKSRKKKKVILSEINSSL